MDVFGKKLRQFAALAFLLFVMFGCRSTSRQQANNFCSVASDPAAFAERAVTVRGEYINAHPHGEIVISSDCQPGLTLVFLTKIHGRDELIDADFGAILHNDPKRRVFARFTGVIRRGSGWYLDVRRVDEITIIPGAAD